MKEESDRETGPEFSLDQWLDTAVRGIRFGPDRRAVRAELYGHLEDKIADLRRIFPDLKREEAEDMALSQMGDPDAIGRELARLHRPWLGYLWRVSRWASVAAAVLLALTLLTSGLPDQWQSWQWTREENQRTQAISQALYEDGTPPGRGSGWLCTPRRRRGGWAGAPSRWTGPPCGGSPTGTSCTWSCGSPLTGPGSGGSAPSTRCGRRMSGESR